MQVSEPNDIKIYNLSAGKSLPEWLSERKRRALLKKNVDIRRRIELIQDFDMPGVSTTLRVSKDGQYILATGIYKPRIKCFDVNNLSLKFERCFDSEAVTFEVLSDDYSKLVFLQCDRYVEFHVAHGRYYRLRIPKFGRDMKYHYPSCDLFLVGDSSEIYRLNLERGQFLAPFMSNSNAINKCCVNPVHHLVVCGTQDGKIEAWDPRSRSIAGTLDCAFSCMVENGGVKEVPSVTSLEFNGALNLAVGTATGQILLYDIRSNKPYFVKDHMNSLPINDVDFHYQQDLVFSMDTSVLKIWNQNNGKLYTSIESQTEWNDFCKVPNTGLFFLANENTKIQTYYVPSLGPAPRWASFLDSLTEELEESNTEVVYDDYKFVTKQELENLNLEHLIGSNLLRAYMHGYFMDMRLYKKAKAVADPFEFEEYRKKKIKESIEKDRVGRVQVKKLPKVNKELALKLMDGEMQKKRKIGTSLLEDERFTKMFENPDFEIDKNTDQYRLLNPVLSKLDKSRMKELKKQLVSREFEPVDDEIEGKNSSEESSSEDEDEENEESSDDDHTWTKEVKKQHRIIQKEHKMRQKAESEEAELKLKQPKMFELRQEEFKGLHNMKTKVDRAPLGERLEKEDCSVKMLSAMGSREMTFKIEKKRDRIMNERNKRHREERKRLVRPAHGIRSKFKSSYFKSRRK